MSKFRRFRQLSANRKLMLLEAAALLPVAWFMVRALPFRWWSHRLGSSTPGESDPRQHASVGASASASEISRSVQIINRLAFGRFTCLMLAMAAQWMLNRRKISSSLVLGTLTERSDDDRLVMKAHAWLRVNAQTVLGHHNGRYTPITSYLRNYQEE
ncbi:MULTISPECIES: lasso peptide biosynthesis B2 protein [Halomonadaceae]|uniref:lasso peptide biosynthesis B2 protein n=1 Tax=Halomonadaceae TaxID=28256 RepID=UPI00159844A9|nr:MULTISPECIES: lasso peptide biosynthesis B2 protein [Halomonas]QJQ94021.1 lasso peptide biosynthesis B2 protein [Halomonas sp. PA5]